ncbi:hypothetical protein GOODEAATRI_032827 [Goodea atripinnis]|uniref:Uncharacterized protein n=1 Tax=Goodea atripinnis TaxID=208336 RepID=A0ABV0PTN3_9TELE
MLIVQDLASTKDYRREAMASSHFLPARRGIPRSGPTLPRCEALDIFGVGRESDDSAPETETDVSTPFLRTEDAEADAKPVQAQGLPMSATIPFPAMGALVSALPDIIAKVAEAKGVPVPAPLAQLLTDDLAGKFAPAHSTRRDPVWPRFPAVTTYLSGAAAEPLQLKAPVSTFTPITRVESLTDQGFSPSSRSRAQSVGSFWG